MLLESQKFIKSYQCHYFSKHLSAFQMLGTVNHVEDTKGAEAGSTLLSLESTET